MKLTQFLPLLLALPLGLTGCVAALVPAAETAGTAAGVGLASGAAAGGAGTATTVTTAAGVTAAGAGGVALAQQQLNATEEQEGKREVHGAVNAPDCQVMEARFKKEGRRVKLTEVRKNTVGVGGELAWECIFEGEDASPGHYGGYDPHPDN